VHYACQTSFGLMITRRRYCIVGALFGADNIVPFAVLSDPEIEAGIRKQCVAFWFDHIVARVPPDFPLLVGSAGTIYPAMMVGAAGAIVAVANVVPEVCVALYELVRAGRHDEARTLQRRLTPLAVAVTGTYGVAGLKAAMEMAGYVGGAPRMPLRPVRADAREALKKLYEELVSEGK